MSSQAGRVGVAPSLEQTDLDSIYAEVVAQQELAELEARLEQLAPLYRLLLGAFIGQAELTHPNRGKAVRLLTQSGGSARLTVEGH